MRSGFVLVLLAGCALAAIERPRDSAFQRVPDPALVPSPEILREQVKEPLFAFVLSMVAADSLGTWTAADVEAFAAQWGAKTDFPLEQLASVSREVVPEGQVRTRDGVSARRRVVFTLKEPRFEFPMPYNIMGYHPGKVVVKSPLVMDEWALGSLTVDVRTEGATRRVPLDALTVFQVTAGANYLDVDTWLDNLLGDIVDDAWTIAFAVAWENKQLVGLGVSTGRKGRRFFGELDFRTGEVEIHGRPVMQGLSVHIREWITAKAIAGPRAWLDD